MSGGERECVLYVDGVDRDRLVRELQWRLDGVVDGRTVTAAGVQVRVGRNTAARPDAGPLAEFVDWPTLIEVYPAEPPPVAGLPAAGRPAPAGDRPAVTPAGSVGVAAVVAEVMAELRRSGNRVVAACDFEDRLPRWDRLRPDRVNGDDLDDVGRDGDDRHCYRGEPFTGTIVDRRHDGGWNEMEIRSGLHDGLTRTYRPDGSLAAEDWYDAGTRVRKRRWHPNGQPELDFRRTEDWHQLAGHRWTQDGEPVRPGWWDRLRGRQLVVDTEPDWPEQLTSAAGSRSKTRIIPDATAVRCGGGAWA